MIAQEILKAIEKAVKPIVPDVYFHPQGRGKVGDRTQVVLIRKGNEEEGERLVKGRIAKNLYFQILLIVAALDLREIIRLQNLIENAVQNIDCSEVTDLWCVQWAGVEVPDAQDSRTAESYDIPNIAGNKQLHIITFRFIVQQNTN